AAGGKWVATGGGGYQWARVVPRAWTIYFAEMVGADVPDELPESWIEVAERQAGHELPARLSEPAVDDPPANPPAEQVVRKVRHPSFPRRGLAGGQGRVGEGRRAGRRQPTHAGAPRCAAGPCSIAFGRRRPSPASRSPGGRSRAAAMPEPATRSGRGTPNP